jgi:hypothetical protein
MIFFLFQKKKKSVVLLRRRYGGPHVPRSGTRGGVGGMPPRKIVFIELDTSSSRNRNKKAFFFSSGIGADPKNGPGDWRRYHEPHMDVGLLP